MTMSSCIFVKWTIKNTAGRPEASVTVYPPTDTQFTDEGFEYGAKNKAVKAMVDLTHYQNVE